MENLEFLKNIINGIKEFFDLTLFSLDETAVTLGTVLYALLSIFLLIFLSGLLRRFLVKRVFVRTSMDIGYAQSIATIVRYVIIILGVIIIIQSTGIDLSALSILAGALGVGIGFGLQNVTNNFISGIIILFEAPIKVGDRIIVGDIEGDVVKISPRATTVVTNDNISMIVPNSEFISSTVINWSHNDRTVRFKFPVGVSYKEDPAIVREILLEVAEEAGGVLKSPAPMVLFDEYGDSSLNFFLVVWTSEYTNRPKILKSQLYFDIFAKFRERGIEIPYPQRDLHFKSGWKAPEPSSLADES